MNISTKQEARKRAKKASEPRTITRAVTHIGLSDANSGKLAALDTLAPVYLALCQQYKDVATGKDVIEDVKGVRTRDYKLKKKLVEALYEIEIIEI